ncbi:penicillin-insensitive murein endopeptidase [Polyangium aurulentum]|uniref:LysM peptidoglycan-binding domain-containing protein n=1 Tax=Polyangium aurulentum TaxID=2567896 RepID=UPI0010ADDD23|nr:penicillin-insensitive murein endopeptidase [Polyangium aurulentum]UQA57727.1 penicillin-insensitive murein endopeptidase [Polyangium aurulentum]
MQRWLLGLVFLLIPGGCASAAPAGAAGRPAAVRAPAAKVAPAPRPATAAEAADGPEEGDDEPDDEVEDGEEAHDDASAEEAPRTSPLLALSGTELEARYRKDPGSVGPLSLGRPNAGALVNGVQMPKGEKWLLLDPACAWGTQETVDAIARSISKVAAEHPDTPPLPIGHISAKRGGRLSPHVSHQAGRDVDIGYYHNPPKTGFVRATADNLDLERTFALVKALVTETDLELLLIDTSVQRMLVKYGERRGEDEAWLDQVFQVRGKHPRPVIRHARGHGNHLHARFYNPLAQELGKRAQSFLVREKVAPAHVSQPSVTHRARSGDTLAILARRYGTTVEAIQAANGLKTIAIKMGRTYVIPVPKPVTPQKTHGKVPKRRLPPQAAAAPAKSTQGPTN